MKLRKIHIENFGKIHDYSLDLHDGLNCIEHENGWGKTTLANFIRVMFFGFENEGKRNGASERDRLRPWTGSAYGGYVEFEVNGRSYRISRKFGAKANMDEFQLIDLETMLESSDFTTEIGKEIFDIDSAGFLHTLFIGQDDIDSTATEDVKAKLSNLSGLSDDIGKYDEVVEVLKDKANSIGGSGKNAELKVCKGRIVDLETKLRSQDGVDIAIDNTGKLLQEQKDRLAEGKKRLAELSAEQARTSGIEALKEKKERYDGLLASLDERQKRRNTVAAAFNGNIPDEDELRTRTLEAARVRAQETSLERYRLSDEESAFLHRYAPMYAAGTPDDASIAHVDGLIKSRAQKERDFEALQFSEEEKKDFEDFSTRFAGKGNVSEDAAQAIQSLSDISSMTGSLEARENQLELMKEKAESAPRSKGKAGAVILLVAGIVLALLGILMLLGSSLAGAVLIAVGALLIVLGVMKKKKGSASSDVRAQQQADIEAFGSALESDREYIRSEKKRIRDMVLSMDLPAGEESMMSSLIQLKSDYDRYRQLLLKQQDERDDRLAEDIQSLGAEIKAFLMPYSEVFVGVTEDADKLASLARNVENYTKIRDKKTQFDQQKSDIDSAKAPLAAYARSVGSYDENRDISERFAGINEAFRKYQDADAEFKRADYLVSDFKRDNDMDEIIAAGSVTGYRPLGQINQDISDLNETQEGILARIHDYNSDLEDSLLQKDELAEAAASLDEEYRKRDELTERHRLVQETRRLLETAHTNLTNRYKKPIEDGFRRYCSMFDGGSADNYFVNAKMELAVDEQGDLRKPDLYSSGSQDKINLCMRMGLIDAMYTGDKPFVIMDDPFTNLDNNRLDGGKEMVRILAEDRQIIYLTCHDSRAV